MLKTGSSNMMKATSLKELANILCLSPSTVSKALNNSDEISDKTKIRVRRIADAYEYEPNQMARNLKLGKSNSIGVVIPNVKDEFFGMVLHGIEAEATKKGYSVIIHISDDCAKKEKACLETFAKGNVDGVLISLAKENNYSRNSCYLDRFKNDKIPLVQFDRVDEDEKVDKVSVDDFDGAYNAIKHLIKTGCKSIAFISPISQTSVGEFRRQGYLQALKLEVAIEDTPILIEIDQYEDLKRAIKKAFKHNEIDGLLAADELSAICAINTVQSMGLRIPEDVSIIGFTDGMFAKCSIPSLTTISQHAKKVGEISVQTLISRIEKLWIGRPEHKIIKTELNLRNSTKTLITE